MQFSRHVEITGGALRDWFVAQCYDSIAVGLLWWAGLAYLNVPLALIWAILAALFQFIPHFGTVLAILRAGNCRDLRRRAGSISLGAWTLRRHHRARRAFAAANDYAADGASADLGLPDPAHRAEPDARFLGTLAGCAAAGSDFCLSIRCQATCSGSRCEKHAAPDASRPANYRRRLAGSGRTGDSRTAVIAGRYSDPDFHISGAYNKQESNA